MEYLCSKERVIAAFDFNLIKAVKEMPGSCSQKAAALIMCHDQGEKRSLIMFVLNMSVALRRSCFKAALQPSCFAVDLKGLGLMSSNAS